MSFPSKSDYSIFPQRQNCFSFIAPDKSCCATIIMADLSTYPLLQRLTGSLDPMTTLDHICLEAYWPWRTVEFQEETAGIAQNGTELVPSPEWCCRSGTVLTYRLEMSTIMVSKYCHHFGVFKSTSNRPQCPK